MFEGLRWESRNLWFVCQSPSGFPGIKPRNHFAYGFQFTKIFEFQENRCGLSLGVEGNLVVAMAIISPERGGGRHMTESPSGLAGG